MIRLSLRERERERERGGGGGVCFILKFFDCLILFISSSLLDSFDPYKLTIRCSTKLSLS